MAADLIIMGCSVGTWAWLSCVAEAPYTVVSLQHGELL